MLVLMLEPIAGHRFEAWFGGELICISDQCELDGARELLKLGHHSSELLTSRHIGKPFDNFVPRTIGELAKLTVSEPNSGSPSFVKYRLFPSGSAQD